MKIAFLTNDSRFFLSHRKYLALDCQSEFELVLILPKSHINSKVRDLGFRVVEYPIQKNGMNPFFDIFTIYKIFRILRKEKPEILHNFTIKPAIYGSLSARWAGVPNIFITITGLGFIYTNSGFKSRALQPFVNFMYRLVMKTKKVRVFFQNPDDQKLFVEKKILSDNFTAIVPGSGVNPKNFYPIESQKQKYKEELKILVPCRMLYDKGVKEAVEAFKKIAFRYPIRLWLVGPSPDGNPSAISKSQLKRWETHPQIDWLGHADNMNELYNEADIVCLPSYREGLPLSLLEASLCRCAILTTDVPGCNFLIQNNANGLIVPPRSVEALTIALETLINDKSKRQSLGDKAREVALASYTYRCINDKIISEYQKCLEAG